MGGMTMPPPAQIAAAAAELRARADLARRKAACSFDAAWTARWTADADAFTAVAAWLAPPTDRTEDAA
jgi:hypothetical protein